MNGKIPLRKQSWRKGDKEEKSKATRGVARVLFTLWTTRLNAQIKAGAPLCAALQSSSPYRIRGNLLVTVVKILVSLRP